MSIVNGDFEYEVVKNWAKWPKDWFINNVPAIGQNSKGVFYVLTRNEYPIIMLDNDGNYLGSWGKGEFGLPHGLSITSNDCVWVTDTVWHICSKFTSDGKRLMELGTKGKPSDTGATTMGAYWQVQRAAGPFNEPTHAVEAPWGDIYVADGYRNVRIHVFSPDGKLKFSWGERGEGPGQFQSPHNLLIDEKGNIFVAEMENLRIQIFTRDGKFIDQWNGIDRPSGMCRDKHGNFFTPELGVCPGNLRWKDRDYGRQLCKTPRVHILDSKGETLGYLGGPADVTLSEDEMCAPGKFRTPHGIFVDNDDNLYITETIGTTISLGYPVPPDCHVLQKFVPVR